MHGLEQELGRNSGEIGADAQGPPGQIHRGKRRGQEGIPVGAAHADDRGVGFHDEIRLFGLDDAIDHGVHQTLKEADHGPALIRGAIIGIIRHRQAGLRRQDKDRVIHHGQFGPGPGLGADDITRFHAIPELNGEAGDFAALEQVNFAPDLGEAADDGGVETDGKNQGQE